LPPFAADSDPAAGISVTIPTFWIPADLIAAIARITTP